METITMNESSLTVLKNEPAEELPETDFLVNFAKDMRVKVTSGLSEGLTGTVKMNIGHDEGHPRWLVALDECARQGTCQGKCEAKWTNGRWYPASIESANKDGTYDIRFDDSVDKLRRKWCHVRLGCRQPETCNRDKSFEESELIPTTELRPYRRCLAGSDPKTILNRLHLYETHYATRQEGHPKYFN